MRTRTRASKPPHAGSARELQAIIATERLGAPFLVFRDDDDELVLTRLDGGDTRLTVGRREENAISFAADERVSRVHAELELVGASLSDLQRRVLAALARPYKQAGGLVTPATNQEIAEAVFLSVDAVKTHLRTLFRKFGISDLPQNQKRVRLVEGAFQSGVISERDL